MPDDPLITHGPDGIAGNADDLSNPALQFMALTRAKTANGVVDGQTLNTTTSFVDQNQTYTSHSSHQAFLREYVRIDVDGAGPGGMKTVATGRLLDGGHNAALGNKLGAIGNWAEVKAQAKDMLGIILTDHDVLNVPLLLTDQYGQFIRGQNGYAQVVTAVDANGKPTAWAEGTSGGLSLPINTVRTGHAFLDDIAHHAAPGFVDTNNNGVMDSGEVLKTPDSDSGMGNDNNPNTYDDELLNAHFITGDGRGNENIALTTVHAIFHAEHNRLVESNKATILATGDVAFLNQWLLVDQVANLTAAQVQALNPASLTWDGERLFQAARFGTEMQYQHMVFEEFARRIQPMIDPFVFNTSPDVDPSVLAEFAHTVYRFGHSMLTGTVDRLDNNLELLNGDTDQQTLLAVFLNPAAYLGSGVDMAAVNANIIRGLSRDVGNEIDEFIVNNLRSNLLGLPLDLAVLNLARGRDTGIPSLNDTRAQLYHDTGLTDLKPYTSWADFAEYLKNPMSIINFIAAYGTHSEITSATTLASKRAAAEEIVFGIEADGTTPSDIADRIAFLNATGTWAGGKLGGLNDVDLWIGGLAEAKPEFGGMLGTTFNYVFEYQMEALQNGDRFYYLTRTQGTNFLNQLEPNSFADMIMRNTALGDVYATHLSGQLFVTPDLFLEQDVLIAQTDYNDAVNDGSRVSEDPTWADDEVHPLTTPLKVTREGGTTDVNGHTMGGLFKFYGPEHVVMGGTEGDDRIYSDKGDDTLWGDGGNDYLNGGTAADDVFGGDGDDVIEDPFGDDILRGERGNDVISDSRGANILFGGAGQDYILVGQDATEVFAGSETDFILGGNGKDFLMGNEGDDWVEGGGGFDTLVGENSELFFNSPIIGHDVLFGHGDETDYDAESGDDIMGSGPSVYRYEGMHGFDWGIAKFDTSNIHFDLQIPIFTNNEENVLRDRFDQVEGVSGWGGDDKLDGDDRGHSGGSSSPDSTPVEMFTDHTLTLEGMNRIAGLQQLLGGSSITSFKNGNIMLGGDGHDTIRGRGGFDTIDGDAWLNVRIKIVQGTETYSAESLTTDTVVAGPNAGKVFHTNADGSTNFGSVAFGGRSLNSLMLDRTINPGEMSIVREILYDNTNVIGPGKNIDTAMFQGGQLEYEIEGTRIVYDAVTGEALRRVNDNDLNDNSTAPLNIRDVNNDGFIRVKDLDDGLVAAPGRVGGLTVSRGALTDDVDLLKNMERLQFADTAFNIGGTTNRIATGTVTISDPSPYVFDHDNNPATPPLSVVSAYPGQVLTATLSNFDDLDGIPLDPATGMPVGLTFDWETTEAGNDGGWAKITSGLTYTVRPVDPAHVLRAVAVFKDGAGVTERLASMQTDNVTAPFSVLENTPTNTVIAPVPFSLDYDPLGFGGTGVTDGDVIQLTHMIQPGQDAGGRFKIVNTGTAAAPIYQLAVANGSLLDFEAVQTPVDNQYQIVIDTYTDTIANGGELMASRQFTVLLNDVEPEFVAVAPTDIQWNGVTPADGTSGFGNLTNGLPGAGATIANLGTTDADTSSGFVYALAAGSSPDFAISSAGVVTRTGSAMAANTTYTLNITSTDTTGGIRTETFTLKTGTNSVFIIGPNGVDTLNASAFDSVLYASGANDTLNGGVGNDSLYGQAGNDVMTGAAGSDIVAGGGGTDTAVFAGSARDFNFSLGTGTLSVTDMTGAEGNDTLSNMETLRFDGVNHALLNGGVTGTTLAGSANADIILGHGGIDTLNGNAGNDILVGGAGDDNVNGGANNDTILWRVGDGRDVVNGDTAAANLAGTDTIHIAGDSSAEIFHIYSLAEAALAGITGLNANTEIVVTRNGTNNASIIAELNNIEEIVIKGFGGDTFIQHGSFVGTSLLTSTITIEGSDGDDTVDISDLTSAHRIVFKSNGGNDTIIGMLRPDDVIELLDGTTAADYTTTTDANGVTTMTNGNHTIIFTSPSGVPQVGNDDDDDDTDTTGGPGTNTPVTGVVRTGTPQADVLVGTTGDDNIIAFAGDDVATGDAGADAISAGEGADFVSGGDGRDVIFAGAGDDQAFGGGQADVIYGDAGADRIFGDGGNDLLVAEIGDGSDVYFGDGSDGGTGIDTLDMSAATANVIVNLGSGPLSNGAASSSQTGNDTIWGIENVNTGSGSDTITASNAVNVMNGGAGNDTYKFTSASAADGDTILGFEPGDRVDLTAIDTDLAAAGDQGFTLVSGATFTAVGQLAVTFETRADGDFTVVQGNTGGTTDADFSIEIAGHHSLTNANLGL